jgi:PRA1 family protein 1
MASAPMPPPFLPVTNPASGSSLVAAGGSDAPIATPAFRLFLSRISDSAQRSLSDHWLWGELLDRSAFSKPDSLSDATSRLRRNLAYFRVNYAAMVAFTLGASLLAHPFSLLILLGLLAAWCFLYLFCPSDQPVVLFGRTFSDRETRLGLGDEVQGGAERAAAAPHGSPRRRSPRRRIRGGKGMRRWFWKRRGG